MNYYYTYVLRSSKDHKLYIGWTVDLIKRINNHNKGIVESTKNRRPLVLVYFEACLNKDNAIKREKQLKSGFGRAYLTRRINLGR
ncbi:GIY-YIG nuclease family protein [Patescibacteria group bacterium]|nr:GIY-YIG nuclease family protein [Patescibacteria group bacterium]